jgi:hypothetical protein
LGFFGWVFLGGFFNANPGDSLPNCTALTAYLTTAETVCQTELLIFLAVSLPAFERNYSCLQVKLGQVQL